MKILLVGAGRHGKDCTAEFISKHFGYTFKSSSMAAAEIFIYEELKEKYNYTSFEECYVDRHNHRAEWFNLITAYNSENKTKLAKAIMAENDMYVGMRNDDEIQACVEQGVFDLVIGVYRPDVPEEDKSSFNIDLFKISDFVIYNNGSLADLEYKVKRLPLCKKRDARPKTGWWTHPLKKMWLDIDGVLADFNNHFLDFIGEEVTPATDWNDYRFAKNFYKVKDHDEFWLGRPKLVEPKDITYPIAGYCTAPACSIETIDKWLENGGFPSSPIINVGATGSKVDKLKEAGCDVMLDDSIYNFVELNSNGIPCYLMTRSHNERFDVGSEMRVKSMQEFIEKIKAK